MRIDFNNAGSVSGFYVVDLATFDQTRAESQILQTFDLTSGLLHVGTRYGQPVWLLENLVDSGACCVWVEEGRDEATHAAAVH